MLNAAGGRIAYRFHARDLHLILGPATRGSSVRFRVFIDGQPAGPAHGTDVDDNGYGTGVRATPVSADSPNGTDTRTSVRDRVSRFRRGSVRVHVRLIEASTACRAVDRRRHLFTERSKPHKPGSAQSRGSGLRPKIDRQGAAVRRSTRAARENEVPILGRRATSGDKRFICNVLALRERPLASSRFRSVLPAFWRHFGHGDCSSLPMNLLSARRRPRH